MSKLDNLLSVVLIANICSADLIVENEPTKENSGGFASTESSNIGYTQLQTDVTSDDEPAKCDSNEICVRFCCADNSCLDDEYFNLTDVTEAQNLKSFKVLKGKLDCVDSSDIEEEWEFLEVD